MAKAKKEIEVPVRVALDTSQVVDLSVAVEGFVDGLADSVETFLDDIRSSIKEFASAVSIDCQSLRASLPDLPAYTPDDDVQVALPDCTTLGADCACNQICGNLETR